MRLYASVLTTLDVMPINIYAEKKEMRILVYLLSLMYTLTVMGCNMSKATLITDDTVTSNSIATYSEDRISKFKYDLDSPEVIFALDKKMMEISALSFDKNGKNLLTVNDEKAIIFKMSYQDCAIVEEFDFGKKGDYEGIEIVGDNIYVLKSNGNIYQTTMKADEKTKEFKTPLSAKNDVEGLAYDPRSKKLILACKGSPTLDGQEKLKATKAFYSFDLNKMKLDKKPVFTITDKALSSFYDKMDASDKSISSDKKLSARLKSFSPSAIAWHPREQQYYVLSSVGKVLVVVDKRGTIKEVEFLNHKLHIQPEGICFGPDESMYISNEGKGLVAKILKYKQL